MQNAAVASRLSGLPISLADVQEAALRIQGQVERTPMRRSRTLSEITGAHIWIKFENLQFTASFKERGALNKLLTLTQAERRAGVIAVSAGNHAQGVAYHAARLGIPATIVMPKGTPFVKVEYTAKHGARVVLEGENLAEAAQHALHLRARENLTFVHPYDDAAVMAGQGTIALEMLEEAPGLEMLVIPVGGGGLIGGNAVAAKALKPQIEIVGAETAMYPSMYAALKGEEPQVGGQTIAEGIAVKAAGALPLEVARALVEDVLLVEEQHLEQAISLFLNVEKTVAEGAGAAGLAAVLAHPQRFAGREVGLILCGGNIDPRLLASVLTRALVREHRMTHLRIGGDDRPGFLARITAIIAQVGGNIIEVRHDRLDLSLPAKSTDLDILVETRDRAHTREMVAALEAAGFPLRKVPA
jgi:threonine dehydratase